ncbi:glycosyltransferase family 2 protein [Desulfobulbus alkaliphilus]|uniref:glycosyltransferase family 2 protein n=1 Tax=Desulfobulbus alkaliphilus TaxID=869814 RepID=UPI001964CEA3|nr:glycosyltransferase family 2 protein [Desulfobulbus alkaliphilus]MBM9538185.1 glycosyltransferase [Desulfobulbus alkaliphilus]
MKLSIITINLNNFNGLAKTLDSVQSQTFQNYEQIVIDGGSTDGSIDIILSRLNNITYWVSEPDNGIYHAMNKGLHVAKGEYVHFLNSGDWLPETNIYDSIFSNIQGDKDIIYGDFFRKIYNESGNVIKRQFQPKKLTVLRFFGSGICHQSIIYKRDIFNYIGKYNEKLKIAGDWDLTLRALIKECKTSYLEFPVVCYEGGGISSIQVENSEKEKEMILRNNLPSVIYADYLYFKELQNKNIILNEYKNWVDEIKNRNVFINYAMVTKWLFEKFSKRLYRILKID